MTDLVHSGSASIPGGAEAAGATMLEKAARALFESYSALAYPDEDDIDSAEAVWGEGRHGFIESARAVLMAIREPNEDVREKLEFGGYCTGFSYGGDENSFNYVSKDDVAEFSRDLIDAILADGEGR